MKIEILNIANPISAEAAEQAGAHLKAISGVSDVSFFDAPASLHARIEDDTPTRAELVAALAKAGVQIKEARPVHTSGDCCGGCGS
ncbi:MAG: hypothetical protein GZ085_09560 [Sulfuriferula multivorans]|uniref:HMA domain-containing protein n=1 Tax=Sulfuriferula multivorans TaxID=1559896 RepID=A0A7C9KA63_9PROT|nr:hypothetical protein [Sulfuriferula multivorans]